MKKIIQVLNVPDAYFRYTASPRQASPIFYRSMSVTTKSARRRAEQRHAWLHEIAGYLRGYVEFPPLHFPDLDVPEDATRLSEVQIEKLAQATRDFWNLGQGPILNVVAVLENNGFIVTRDELGADSLDAFSEFDHEQAVPYMVLGTDKASAVRSRFDAAHELGHMVLHRKLKGVRLGLKTEHAMLERQAHRFAAAFLLPEKSFAAEFYSATLDALLALKKKWKVSIGMMIMRAEQLQFIDPITTKRLWVNYSRRGWRTCEPLDEEIPCEQPRLFQRSFEMLLQERVLTPEQILLDLPFSPDDIEELAGLPDGLLTSRSADEGPPISILRPRQGPAMERLGQPAPVISFPKRPQ